MAKLDASLRVPSRKIKAPRWRRLLDAGHLGPGSRPGAVGLVIESVPAPASVPPEKQLEDLKFRVE